LLECLTLSRLALTEAFYFSFHSTALSAIIALFSLHVTNMILFREEVGEIR
jgi:hypothetical protein